MPSDSTVAALPRRDRLFIAGCVVVVTALAWAYLFYRAREMSSSASYEAAMAKMGMAMDRPWAAVDLFFAFLMWLVMMIGMMAGSAAPVLLLFASAYSARTGRGAASFPVLMFGLGYLAVWAGFSAAAALLQWAMHDTAVLSPEMAVASPRVAGGILLAAGVYQFASIKNACLTECRSPLGFLMSCWRDGSVGAFRMGVRHGVFCVGCCWALMCLLFVVGVMNLAWVAAVTLFVLAEKLGPLGLVTARIGGALMIVAGALLSAHIL